MPEKLRMNAYYYSFRPTGCYAVDKILSAVARAGKGYHHTNQWDDPGDDGTSYIDLIQSAADQAAKQMSQFAPVEGGDG